MTKLKLLVFVFILFSFLKAFGYTQNDNAQIAASVDNHNITFQEFLDRYEDYLIFTGVQDNIPARFAVLNNMINEILMRNYDDNSKVYNNPEYKKEAGWVKKEATLAFLKDREVYAKITCTEDELREAYKRSKVKIAVRHLYAPTEKEADNLYKLVRMGISFNELAKQAFSDSVLKNNGGYLGYITWGDTDPEFENAAYSLRIGEVSQPVKTSQGYSIIKVEDRIADPFTTEDNFVSMKHKLERAVRISKKKPSEQAYLKAVFNQNKVELNEKALLAVLDDIKKSALVNIESNNSTQKNFKNCVSYNGKIFSQNEVEQMLYEVPKYNRDLLTDKISIKQAVLGLIMQDALLEIAKSKGYDTTSYVKDTYNKLENNVYLNYKRNEVLETVPVADSEIVKYYKDNIGNYSGERELNVQEIVVERDSLALALKNKVDKGEDFGKLAQKYSLRTWSAKNNGVMGFSAISNFGDMKDTLWNSAIGKTFGPIPFDKYYGIFRLLGKKDSEPININFVRPQIINAVKNIKGFPYMKKHIEELTKKTKVNVNQELIKNYKINIAG